MSKDYEFLSNRLEGLIASLYKGKILNYTGEAMINRYDHDAAHVNTLLSNLIQTLIHADIIKLDYANEDYNNKKYIPTKKLDLLVQENQDLKNRIAALEEYLKVVVKTSAVPYPAEQTHKCEC